MEKGEKNLLCRDRQILFFLSCAELCHIGLYTLGQVSNVPAKSRCVYVCMMPLFILSIKHIEVTVFLCVSSLTRSVFNMPEKYVSTVSLYSPVIYAFFPPSARFHSHLQYYTSVSRISIQKLKAVKFSV